MTASTQPSLIFNSGDGYRFDNGLRLQLDVLKLFNAQTNPIEYYYVSRLPDEPLVPPSRLRCG
jgi:hypothetical protein